MITLAAQTHDSRPSSRLSSDAGPVSLLDTVLHLLKIKMIHSPKYEWGECMDTSDQGENW